MREEIRWESGTSTNFLFTNPLRCDIKDQAEDKCTKIFFAHINRNMSECKFCGKKFETHQKLGGHIVGCLKNPSRIIRVKSEKIGKKFICAFCEKEFTVKDGTRKFCSKSCSSKSRKLSDETKEKIRKSLQKDKKIKINICIICGIEFESDRKRKTCSQKCRNVNTSNASKGKIGGYRIKSGKSQHHGAYYNGIWMDSSWELRFVKRLDQLNIRWERDNKIHFKYIDEEGIERKYIPDFYLPSEDLYIEIKGFWTEKVKYKMKEICKVVKNICILDSLDKIEDFCGIIDQRAIDGLPSHSERAEFDSPIPLQ